MARKLCIDCNIRPVSSTDSYNRSHGNCDACSEYFGWENTHSDDDHDNDPDATCPVCDPTLDPRNGPAPKKGHTNTVAHTRTSHAGHDHPVTPAARAACRKAARNA